MYFTLQCVTNFAWTCICVLPKIIASKFKILIAYNGGYSNWISSKFSCLYIYIYYLGDRGSTMVKVLCYKSEVRCFDPSWCQWIFHWYKILPIAIWPWSRLSLQKKWVPGVFPGGKGGRCVRLTTYHHPVRLSRNLGALTSWNPLGLSKPVMGLLYLYIHVYIYII